MSPVRLRPSAPAYTWLYDITVEEQPLPMTTWQVEGIDTTGEPQEQMTGCHQPIEDIKDTEVPFAWFAQGLRFVDISNPNGPREVASYMPDIPAGETRVCSNDVFRDARGLVYVIDRVRGFNIVERTGA